MRILLVGKSNVGKTSLVQALAHEALKYKKTQAAEYCGEIIDLPGEYIENPRYYNAIITMSFDADLIVFVQDVVSEESYFPPYFADVFNKQVIGMITKMDLMADEKMLERARQHLHQAGVTTIYEVSALTQKGLQVIENMICLKRGERSNGALI
jgi:ethanolamine utilization protein EutP